MAIAGHVSPKMLAHYSHVRLDAKRHALDALSRTTDGGVTSQTTSQKEQPKPQVLDLVVDVTGIEPVTPCLQSIGLDSIGSIDCCQLLTFPKNRGTCFSLSANPNGMKTLDSCTVRAQWLSPCLETHS